MIFEEDIFNDPFTRMMKQHLTERVMPEMSPDERERIKKQAGTRQFWFMKVFDEFRKAFACYREPKKSQKPQRKDFEITFYNEEDVL